MLSDALLACYFGGIITMSSLQACACSPLLNSSQQTDNAAPASKTARRPFVLASCWQPHTNYTNHNQLSSPHQIHNMPQHKAQNRDPSAHHANDIPFAQNGSNPTSTCAEDTGRKFFFGYWCWVGEIFLASASALAARGSSCSINMPIISTTV